MIGHYTKNYKLRVLSQKYDLSEYHFASFLFLIGIKTFLRHTEGQSEHSRHLRVKSSRVTASLFSSVGLLCYFAVGAKCV